ncbi:MAG: heavy metal-binding domain-containing protein [Bacteroidota bacterium]
MKKYILPALLILVLYGCQGRKDNQGNTDDAKIPELRPGDSVAVIDSTAVVRPKTGPVTGIIDLKKIDANKDGKVFECAMDWNVLSDQPGKCSQCGMDLTEYTRAQARTNLVQNGFKVK